MAIAEGAISSMDGDLKNEARMMLRIKRIGTMAGVHSKKFAKGRATILYFLSWTINHCLAIS